MNDVKKSIWNKRIPPFVGVLFLALSIGTIGWLSSNAILFGTKAAADNTPKDVKITNISDSTFTVSYMTDDPAAGTVNYGKTQIPNQVAFDDRDQQGSTAQHNIHHITVKNLDATSKYFFTITSGDETFLNNGVPYEVATIAKNTDLSPDQLLLKGKVALEDGTNPTESVVYVSLTALQTLSAITNAKGEYNLDLSTLTGISPQSVLNLQVFDSIRQSKVSLMANQGNPVPLIILSKDYDFALGTDPLAPSPTASASATITPVAFPKTDGEQTTKPQILSPEDDQEFKDQQPLFRGTAIPGAEVEIIIESENPITTTVEANNNGNWQYRPATKLAPGNHTITIKTTDASGIIRTITQSFVVFAEGSVFVEPSVSPTPIQSGQTARPTTTPTMPITPTKAPTATPTIKATPTKSVATLAPTKALSPSVSQTPIPVTGNISFIVTVIGITAAIAIGALLFFLTAV